MKKINILLMFFLICSGMAACGNLGNDNDEEKIRDRIQALEDAINDDDYIAFMNCMHTGTNFFDPITSEVFDDLFEGTVYSFHDLTISVSGDNASVDCTATVDSVDGYSTEFTLQTEGDDWYIYDWYEDSDEIFDRYTLIP